MLMHRSRIDRLVVPVRAIFSSPAVFKREALVAADFFVEAHRPGFQKSPELHLQPQAKYPKFVNSIPNSEIWVIMTNHPII